MHVLHIIPTLDVGGAEVSLTNLIKLDDEDISYSIVCIIKRGSLKAVTNKDVTIYNLSLASVFSAPRVFLKLVFILRKIKPDIIHTWMYHANLLGIIAKLMGYNNIVWGIRTTDSIGLKASFSSRFIRKLNIIFSKWIPSHIVYVAHAAKLNHENNGYNRMSAFVIPNGFDTTKLNPISIHDAKYLKEKLGILDDEIIIGSVGRFSIEKDHQSFIAACGILLDKKVKFKVLLVGRELTNENQQLIGWIKTTGHIENFILCGEQSEIVPYYSIMDIFCLHSRNEGFPNVLGEAMAIGIPSVSTDVGDARKLVDGIGIIVPKEDPKLLANGLITMIEKTKEEKDNIRKASRDHIVKYYSLKNTIKCYQKLYREMLQ